MKKILLFGLLSAGLLVSCKKNKGISDDLVPGGSGSKTALDLLKDSVYAYAKEEYLWYDALPDIATFNTSRFTGSSDVSALQSEIDALSQYKINTTTNKPYEYDAAYVGTAKYSYIDEGQAATSIGGTGGDFGFALSYISASDLRLRYVYPRSSAAAAGLARGYKVLTVDDVPVTLTTGTSSDPTLIKINASLGNNTVKLSLQRPDGSTFTANVSRTSYTINPVIKYSIITTSTGKKVGYFAFSRFTTLDNSQAEIDKAFASFMADNITELVVDLRYNGGGAVKTSEYIANYMVPAAANGKTMYTEYFNNKLQADIYPLLAKKYRIDKGDFHPDNNTFKFAKKGTLSLNRAFFLVTGSTASASELLINNMQPALPAGVQIIGRTTYGKPVGFFGIPVGRYDLYLTEFESRNGAGTADFYQGMVPAGNFPGADVADDVTKDFGDPAEGLLSRAINFINKGNYTITGLRSESALSATEKTQLREINQRLDAKQQFSGMVHDQDLKRIQK